MSHKFETENDLCRAFLAFTAKDDRWTAYPETAEWDILMVRKKDGLQIGIEAKLKLNPKVLLQSLPSYIGEFETGPDCRAILVPDAGSSDLRELCGRLGVTVLMPWRDRYEHSQTIFLPHLPSYELSDNFYREWFDWCPAKRHKLPEFVPQVPAGVPSPIRLTHWKVSALKVLVILESRPITIPDFKAVGIGRRDIWTGKYGFLERVGAEKKWIAGPRTPKHLIEQHPNVYAKLKEKLDNWMPKET